MKAQHTPGPLVASEPVPAWLEVAPGVWKHRNGAEVQRLARRYSTGRYFIALGVLDARSNERKYRSLEAAQLAAIAKAVEGAQS